jgi:hypothetical protein
MPKASMSLNPDAARPASIIDRVIEGSWLALVALVPLAMTPENLVAGAIQGPKIFVFRSLTTILFTALLISAVNEGAATRRVVQRPSREAFVGLLVWMRSIPLALPVLAVLVANVLAWAFSPVPSVSWGGVDTGFDSYGLLTVLSFVVIFLAVASRLKTQAQLERLLWAITGSSILIGIYGFAQHFGYDFLGNNQPAGRLTLTFGNPIFGAAYLTMSIPLALTLWETWRLRISTLTHFIFGIGLIAFPLFGIVYSLSRGAFVSIAFAIGIYLTLTGYVFGLRFIRRPAMVVAVSFALVFATGWIPAPGGANTLGSFADRMGSIGGALTPGGGGISGRYSIWEVALESYVLTPWIDETIDPSLPALGVGSLRRVVGFGQDTFGIAYRLVGSEMRIGALERNAHNFAIHTLIELGMLGVLAYLWLGGATLFFLRSLVRSSRRSRGDRVVPAMAVGMVAMFAGRALEQTIGKAQISDLMLMWMAFGMVTALVLIDGHSASAPGSSKTSARRPLLRQRSVYSRRYWPIVVLISIATFFFWWQGPLADIRALTLSAQAKQAGGAGDPVASGALFQQAIDIAPHAAIPRLLLGQGLLNDASQGPGSTASLDSLYAARDVLAGIYERNPMDLRAREWAASSSQSIAIIDPGQWPTAVHEAKLAVAISPGRWEQLQSLAWVLSLSGDLDQAMLTVEQAQAVGGSESPDSHLLYYIEAKIALVRGNAQRADIALQKLRNFSHEDVSFLVDDVQGET